MSLACVAVAVATLVLFAAVVLAGNVVVVVLPELPQAASPITEPRTRIVLRVRRVKSVCFRCLIIVISFCVVLFLFWCLCVCWWFCVLGILWW